MINLYQDDNAKEPIDTSLMLNFERVLNGANKQWLKSKE